MLLTGDRPAPHNAHYINLIQDVIIGLESEDQQRIDSALGVDVDEQQLAIDALELAIAHLRKAGTEKG